MQFGFFHHRPRSSRQQGYIMLVLMLMAALVIIGLAMELPNLTTQLRRDREQELIHRGAQYARAVKKFYKKTGAYPANIDQLVETNHLRFLRKKYKDPITGEDFRLLHLGEVQLSLKPSGMTTGPGVAPGAGNSLGGISNNTPASIISNANAFGSGSQGAGGLSQFPDQSNSGQGPGLNSNSGMQGPGAGVASGGGAQSAGQAGGFGSNSGSSSPFSSLSQMGGKNPKLGGGPIIGVASTSEKRSFHVFNEKDHYNDWEFIYDPSQDRGGLIKGPYNGTPAFGGGQVPGAVGPGQMNNAGQGGSPFGGSPSASPFGSSPSAGQFGSSPQSSPSNSPQQSPFSR